MKGKSMQQMPFRLGTTSYIIPVDILPNVRFLAGKVADVELVLFEVEDGLTNLPDESTLEELKQMAAENDLTYTVHLPLDLELGGDRSARDASIQKALGVIERTKGINPFSYVLHLDGKAVRTRFRSPEWEEWTTRTRLALAMLVSKLNDPSLLAVENLEGYPPDFWDAALAGMPFSRCADIGHLWLDGHDPLPYLRKNLAEIRVIHLHGIGERDHQSLAHVPPEELSRVLEFLVRADFRGVLTLEVFGEDDFNSSMDAVEAAIRQLEMEA